MYNRRGGNVSPNERGTQLALAVISVALLAVALVARSLLGRLLWSWALLAAVVPGLCMVGATFMVDWRVQVIVAAVYCAALILVALTMWLFGWLWVLPALLVAAGYIAWTCHIHSQTGRRRGKPARRW